MRRDQGAVAAAGIDGPDLVRGEVRPEGEEPPAAHDRAPRAALGEQLRAARGLRARDEGNEGWRPSCYDSEGAM